MRYFLFVFQTWVQELFIINLGHRGRCAHSWLECGLEVLCNPGGHAWGRFFNTFLVSALYCYQCKKVSSVLLLVWSDRKIDAISSSSVRNVFLQSSSRISTDADACNEKQVQSPGYRIFQHYQQPRCWRANYDRGCCVLNCFATGPCAWDLNWQSFCRKIGSETLVPA